MIDGFLLEHGGLPNALLVSCFVAVHLNFFVKCHKMDFKHKFISGK